MTTRRYSALSRCAARPAGAALLLLLAGGGCGFGTDQKMREADAALLTGGSAPRGRKAIAAYGCGTCHAVPGVPGATATVGPPLSGMSQRGYIAGVLTNSPEHMVRWIRDPRGVDSLTAMPNLGVTDQDARDIAAYLYSIK